MATSYPGVYVEEFGAPRAIAGVPTSVTAFVGRAMQGPRVGDAGYVPTRIRSWGEFEATFGGLTAETTLGYAVAQYFANGGTEALVVRVGGDSGLLGDADISAPELAAQERGLWALDRAPDVNLLCIPPLSRAAAGHVVDIGAATRQAAATYCRKRRAVFIADPLSRWRSSADVLGPDGVRNAGFGLAPDANAALYFPFLRAADPLQGGAAADFAPCGAVAGVIARTDSARGVWKAPSGDDAALQQVIAPAIALGDVENAALSQAAVNCLRLFPVKGTLVWGARSWIGQAEQASDWKYLSVRRLALFLEASIERGTRWAAFEPNGEELWAKLRECVRVFLRELFRAGAFAGTHDQEAYFVRCDLDTHSQADLGAGNVNIEVGFAPLRPAEFVQLHIRHTINEQGGSP